jgi:hypothetical protein
VLTELLATKHNVKASPKLNFDAYGSWWAELHEKKKPMPATNQDSIQREAKNKAMRCTCTFSLRGCSTGKFICECGMYYTRGVRRGASMKMTRPQVPNLYFYCKEKTDLLEMATYLCRLA